MSEILYNSITLEGNIGAGKTSLAKALAESLDARLLLESFENNPFLELFYQERERFAFQVEMFFLAERYHQLSKHLLGDIFQRHTVSDYLFAKSAIFSGINLEGAEHELFLNLYRIMDRFMPRPDIMIYLHVPVDDVIERIKERGRSYEANIQPSYLESIESAYFEFLKEEKRFPIVLIDQGNDALHDISTLNKSIMDILSKEWAPGMSRYMAKTEN